MAPAARALKKTPELAEATRTRLLDSAGRVFAEHGFHAATIREICARAGVNLALVNYHFGDKLELYTEVLRHSIGTAKDCSIASAIDPDSPPEEALRALIRTLFQTVCSAERPEWHFRLMIHELGQPTPAMNKVIDETMSPIYNRVRRLIQAILAGAASEEKTRLCAHSVISQIVHYARARHVIARLWPELELTGSRIEQIATHIADFSLAYLHQESAVRRTE